MKCLHAKETLGVHTAPHSKIIFNFHASGRETVVTGQMNGQKGTDF